MHAQKDWVRNKSESHLFSYGIQLSLRYVGLKHILAIWKGNRLLYLNVNFANFVNFLIQIWCICLRIDKYVIICQAS